MELRSGYKQTEAGIIPEDWGIDCIENIARVTTGGKNTQDRVDDGEYPFFVRSQTIERINSYSFDGEAVLTAGDGVGTGKVFHYINGKFDAHQRVYLISTFIGSIEGYYFYLYFSSRFYNRIMQMTAKSSVDSVRREMIAKMAIPLPAKKEQRAIAKALSDVDALIASLDKLITKKRNIKQGAMQQLLTGKKRLPGFGEAWKVKKLEGVFLITAGGDLDNNNFSLVKDEKYCFPVYSNSLSEKGLYGYTSFYIQEENTITVTARGTVGFANARDHKYSAIGRVLILSPLTKINCFFAAEYINNRIRFVNESTGVPQLTAPQISKYYISIPSYEEQISIAKVLSDMDKEITAIEARRDKTKAIKQCMMQALLTGRIRLL
ncbi:MAG: restriction endonuclease subunit S [Methylobacter sp.]|nr:restriction endonuclease subunit S [Methylobacter sp.]